MPIDLDEQLRAFGATLQRVVGEPITSPGADIVPLPHRPDRRWIALAGAAACIALAVAGVVWIAAPDDSGAPVVGPATTLLPEISTEPSGIVPDRTVPANTDPDDAVPASTIPLTPPGVATPLIDGRTVRFPDCPRVVLDTVPDDWALRFEATEGSPIATLAAPSGAVRVSVGDLGPGQVSVIDGYQATTVVGSRVTRILTARPECGSLEIDASDLAATDEASLLASIDLDDRELTEVDAQIGGPDGTDLFDRGLFERVDVDPYVDVVSVTYGPPDSDTGWLPMPADFAAICGQHDEYRSIFWDDLRVVFERTGAAEVFTAWAVGDQGTGMLAPDDPHEPSGALGLTAADGVQIGADVSVLDQFPMVGDNGDGTYDIAGAQVRSVSTVDGVITGVSQGRNDCA